MLQSISIILSVITIIGAIVYFVGFYRSPKWDKFVQTLDHSMLSDEDYADDRIPPDYCDFCGVTSSENWWIGLRECQRFDDSHSALSCDKCKHHLFDAIRVDMAKE